MKETLISTIISRAYTVMKTDSNTNTIVAHILDTKTSSRLPRKTKI